MLEWRRLKRYKKYMRRKLAWYNLSLIIGISIGYIFFEKNERVYAFVLFFIFTICLNIIFDIELMKMAELKICLGFTIAGMVVLSSSFFYFSNLYNEFDKASDIKIRAFVKDIEIKDEKISLVISEGRGINSICNIYYKKSIGNDGGNNRELSKSIKVGDEIVVSGKRKIPKLARNPEMFNYRLYLKSKKISSLINAKSVDINGIKEGKIWKFRRKLYSKKREFISKFDDSNDGKNKEVQGFIQGVLFGDTSLLDDDIGDEFRKNGTAHVLAVSGLHIGFIISMLRFLSRSNKTVPVTALIILILILYGELTGWNISTIRSVIIAIMALISFYIKRPFDLLSAVSTASILILSISPYYLFNSGFQMSFLAMLGITFISNSFGKLIGGKIGGVIGIQMLMTSYSAFAFNILNPLSIIINIPVVFIISIIVPLGLILILLNIIFDIWAGVLIKMIINLSRLTIFINHFLYLGGSTSLNVRSRGILFFSLGIGVLVFIFSEQVKIWIIRRDKRRIFISLLTMIFFISALTMPFNNKFIRDEIVFIDVGQGDAIHVRTANKLIKGRNIMFDGGGSRDYDVGEKILKPYLLKNGAGKVDFAFISHLHEDHYKGMSELSRDFSVERLFLDKLYENGKNGKENKIYSRERNFLEIGDAIKVDKDIEITVLWPYIDDYNSDEVEEKGIENDGINDGEKTGENDKNMVVMLRYRKIKLMITGDLTGEDEEKMLEYYKRHYGNYKMLRCDILKSPHHGSRYSNSEKFLRAVSPKAVVIQAGENNIYGHPHEETLERIKRLGIDIYRTDQSGAIGVDIRGGNKFIIDKMINEK